jgi:hypothetical protein
VVIPSLTSPERKRRANPWFPNSCLGTGFLETLFRFDVTKLSFEINVPEREFGHED